MTLYLIDENILREFGPKGNTNARAWLTTVNDADFRLSAITFFEKRRGCHRQIAKGGAALAKGQAGLAAIEMIEAAYAAAL